MKTNQKAFCIAVLMTFLLVPMFSSAVLASQSNSYTTTISGNTLPVLKSPDVMKTGPLAANQNMFLVLSLNTYQPPPALSTVFIPTQSGAALMATQSEAQQKVSLIESFLKQSGLKIVNVLPDLSAIWVSGSVASVESAFKVSINQYQQGSKQFFAADRDPSVPSSIADSIVAVVGLDNYQSYQPAHIVLNLKTGSVAPDALPSYMFDPYEIRSAYDFASLYTIGTPDKLTGKGINIAILDAYGDPTMTSDWSKFCHGYNIITFNPSGPWYGGALPTSPSISTYYPTGTPVSTDAGWALETSLDVEWVHAMAPGAKINLVISYDNSFAEMLAAFQWIVATSKGAIVSMSFGAEEGYCPPAYIQAWDATSRIAATKGVTLIASSGDYGYDPDDPLPGGNIMYPSSDPYTIAVGGTTLTMTGSYPGTYSSESAWGVWDYEGSGGGQSAVFPKQSWQYGQGVLMDGVRDTPDVAMDADPSTGVLVYNTFALPPYSWWIVGGTSVSAPLWAALMAIVDQALGASGSSGGLGLATPWLYNVFRSGYYTLCFNDITTGGQVDGWPAWPGYDLVTGIGTPNAENLLWIGTEFTRTAQVITWIPYAKAVAVDSKGNLYIGTFQRENVEYPIGTLYELKAGSTTPQAIFTSLYTGGITDIAVDKNNKVYFMTYGALYKYDPTTGIISVLAQPYFGWGVCVDSKLDVYFSDLGVPGLFEIPYGGSVTFLGIYGSFSGMCADSSNNIYVMDFVNNVIMMLNAAHTSWTTWKTCWTTYALLDLRLDSRKTAYISDWYDLDVMDDYQLFLSFMPYGGFDENNALDSKGGVYFVEWDAGYSFYGPGLTCPIEYLPPQTPT